MTPAACTTPRRRHGAAQFVEHRSEFGTGRDVGEANGDLRTRSLESADDRRGRGDRRAAADQQQVPRAVSDEPFGDRQADAAEAAGDE
jgi:hypothetical protein